MPTKKPSIHAGHRARMRQRYYATGLRGFQPHEILELILYCVIPKKDVNPLAHSIINRFGSLSKAMSADRDELLAISGVGPRTCNLIEIMRELLPEYGRLRLVESRTILSAAQAVQCVRSYIHPDADRELIVLLENHCGQMLSGRTFPADLRDPLVLRGILQAVLSVQAHSVIIAITGCELRKPSRFELSAIQNLIALLRTVTVYTTELLLLSGEYVYSMREVGMLTDAKNVVRDHPDRTPVPADPSSPLHPNHWTYWCLSLRKYPDQNHWYLLSNLKKWTPPKL